MATRAIPKGWHSVTPRLFVAEPKALVAFLGKAFGAMGKYRDDGPSEIRIGNSLVMVSGERSKGAPNTAWFYLYVEDADRVFARAIKAGAQSIEPMADTHYGDRRGTLRDPAGNTWQIATHKKDLTLAQIRRRLAKPGKKR